MVEIVNILGVEWQFCRGIAMASFDVDKRLDELPGQCLSHPLFSGPSPPAAAFSGCGRPRSRKAPC